MSSQERNDYVLLLAEEGQPPPEPPEPLIIYRRLRALNLQWYAGGYVDQPYLMLKEHEVVADVERHYQDIDVANERRAFEALLRAGKS